MVGGTAMRDETADRRTVIGLGAMLAGASATPALAEVQRASDSGAAAGYTPAFEPQDAWLDDPAKRHRMVLDTTSPGAAGSALSNCRQRL